MSQGSEILDIVKRDALSSPAKGQVAINPQMLTGTMKALSDQPNVSRIAERGAMTGVGGVHELFERGVNPKNVVPLYSHLAPEVLLKEHNALSKLTGPGADQARKSFRGARKNSGEAEHMRNLLVQEFGPRASQFLEEGQKVPKGMMKALRKKLRDNPGRLQDAVPKKSMVRRFKDARASSKRQQAMLENIKGTMF